MFKPFNPVFCADSEKDDQTEEEVRGIEAGGSDWSGSNAFPGARADRFEELRIVSPKFPRISFIPHLQKPG